MEKIDLDKIWSILGLEAEDIPGSGVLKRLLSPEYTCRIFLGIETNSKRRLFSIEVPYSVVKNLDPLPQSQGFEAEIKLLGDEQEHYFSIMVSVKNELFNDIFSSLTNDIIENIKVDDSEEAVVNLLVSRLLRWQHFLERYSNNSLGKEAQQGLYGELYFLRECLIPCKGELIAMQSWAGPKKTIHDFQLENCAVEVKTSIAKQHQKIYITSERQLDDKDLDALFLYYLSLNSNYSSGESLVELVESIRESLQDTFIKALFEDALFEAGYLDIHERHYTKTLYTIREQCIFHVKDGFPRFTESDLLNGVGDVKYSVLVSECKHYEILKSEFIAWMKRYDHESG